MASSFLDDLISNPSADADAVSALVGSLESQLSNANVGASNNTQSGLGFSTNAGPTLQSVNAPTTSTTNAASTATFAGNGNSHNHATATCVPASVPTGTGASTNTSAVSTVSSLQLSNNTAVHSLMPNGNTTSMVNIQQFTGTNAVNLPNGTVASGTTATTLSGLVIQQSGQKIVASSSAQQQTMIIPTKMTPAAGAHVLGQQQTTVIGSNGTTSTINQPQVLRPQVIQQQQPQQASTVINSAGTGILPTGVQVVNMNAMRPQGVQNVAAINNAAHRQLAPRVVLTPQQVVGARPGQVGLTLQALQGLQAAGAQGHLLVKTESGQYQLLRVGPGPVAGATVGSSVVTSGIPSLQNVAVAAQQPQQQQHQQTSQQIAASSAAVVSNINQPGTTYRLQVPVSTTIQPIPAAPVPGTVAGPTAVAHTTSTPGANPPAGQAGSSGQMTPDTAKVKCKNFLSTLLRLASEQPESVATNVQTLIQGLVDGKVEPEEFTTKLQRELNSSPQPCLIPFLKKSLPYLRHSLATRDMTIDGIRPPALSSVPTPQPMVVQQQQQAGTVNRVNAGPTQVQTVRPMGGQVRVQAPTMIAGTSVTTAAASPRPARPPPSKATPKAKTAQQAPKVVGAPVSAASTVKSEASSSSGEGSTPLTFTINLPPGGVSTTPTAGGVPTVTVASMSSGGGTPGTATKPAVSTASAAVGSKGPAVGPPGVGLKDPSKEKKAFTYSSSSLVGLSGDNDINDVAAMGGVNLAEESQRILGSTEMIGTQIRSCKDENFLFSGPLSRKIQQITSSYGLGDPSPEVVSLISHATQERLKTILEKLSVIAEHRMEVVKTDVRYEVQQDVKGQLKFLEELDKLERRRHSEIQREMLLKAAKSRSKAEDPEQAKLKAKAKEMQRAEMEELRQREANMTALQAIGVRKKPKLDLAAGTTGSFNQVPLRPRVKRVNLRDLLFLLKEEKGTVRSQLLYKAYLK